VRPSAVARQRSRPQRGRFQRRRPGSSWVMESPPATRRISSGPSLQQWQWPQQGRPSCRFSSGRHAARSPPPQRPLRRQQARQLSSRLPLDVWQIRRVQGVDLEKLEYSVCPRSVQLCDGVLILLRRDMTENEVSVSLHLPLLQHYG
jgi:hypothetical protein